MPTPIHHYLVQTTDFYICRVFAPTITDYMWSCVAVYRVLLSLYVNNCVNNNNKNNNIHHQQTAKATRQKKRSNHNTSVLYILSTIFH